MSPETHSELASFIWSICNLLRGPYKRNEYRKVILPLTVLRRFDCLLAPTKARVLEKHAEIKAKPENVVRRLLEDVTGRPFYNLSKLDLPKLLDDPNQLAPNLNSYINGFSPNVRDIMERFAFDQQIARMAEKNLLYQVVKAFAADGPVARTCGQRADGLRLRGTHPDRRRAGERGGRGALHPARGDQAHGQPPPLAGEGPAPQPRGQDHLRPRLRHRRHAVGSREVHPRPERGGAAASSSGRTGTTRPGPSASPTCSSRARTPTTSGWATPSPRTASTATGTARSSPSTTCSPIRPSAWSGSSSSGYIEKERDTLGYDGRFGAGTPRINDGSLLFLQHMLSKMREPEEGGSRIGIVFNGSPLFTGDAGSGESNIRQWIIENDWLEAIVALPDQLFYNTGISTYIWVLTNRKEPAAQGQDPAHRRAAVLREDAEEPGQQAQQDRRCGERRARPDRRHRPHSRQLPGRRDAHGQDERRGEDARRQQGLRQRRLRLLTKSPSSARCD